MGSDGPALGDRPEDPPTTVADPTPYRPRILVVDDDPQIHRFLTPAFEATGYDPIRADNGREALAEIARQPLDAVVLDLGLPDLDGHEVLIKARGFYSGPILILSARDREFEKIAAFDSGADDYIEKPFGVGELLARLRVAMRRRLAVAAPSRSMKVSDLEIDLVMRRVLRDGQPVKLSRREYDLLVALAKGRGRVITHKLLLAAVWGPTHEQDVQYLRVFVGHLRQKLETDPAKPQIIVTEPGVGYRLAAET